MRRSLAAVGVTLAALGLSSGVAVAAPGDLDPTFDGDGKLILPVNGHPEATLVQPDGKIVLVGSYPGNDFTVRRLTADGSVDRGFDGDGTAVADLGADDQAYSAVLQPDGKILVAGTSTAGSTRQGAVARFDTDGALDKTFDPGGGDGDGKKLLPSLHGAEAVLAQPDGKVVVTGHYFSHFATLRLDAKGAPDGTTFEPAFIEAVNSEYVNAAALAPDGRIVLAGVTIANGQNPTRAAFAVYKPDGSLDKAFAGTGTLALEPDALSTALGVLVQPDGRIVAAGASNQADPRMVVVRLTRDGKPDGTFGAAGRATADFEGQDHFAAVALAPDGRILLAGTAADGAVLTAARLTATGSLDGSFGSGGQTTFAFDSLNLAYSAAVQPDGKLVVAAQTAVGGTVARMAVARLVAEAPPVSGGGGSPQASAPPLLSGLRVAPARFALGRALPRAVSAASRQPHIHFILSEPGRVRFTFRRVHRGGFRNVRGSFAVDARAGANRVRFSGRLTKRRRLAPGRYRVIATPVDAAGTTGRARRATFTVLPARA